MLNAATQSITSTAIFPLNFEASRTSVEANALTCNAVQAPVDGTDHNTMAQPSNTLRLSQIDPDFYNRSPRIDLPQALTMVQRYRWQRHTGGQESTVRYLWPNELPRYQLHIHKGKFYDNDNKLLNTWANNWFLRRYFIFVLSRQGELYAASSLLNPRFRHSSFLRGLSVAAAGKLVVKNGEIKELEGESGHYRPTAAHIKQCAQFFAQEGVDMTKVKVTVLRRPVLF